MGDRAIVVDGVSKRFRLYHERNQSLKSTLMRRGRAKYTELMALDDVSFEVDTGTTFGIIGENGSGKSTMLKCMARILRPDVGTIASVGKISALLELGAGFHPELSGRDNVYLNGSILGLSRKEIDRRFDAIVDFAFADTGQEDRIDTPVKDYSSGMYVKLGFSVAINVDPDLLLVDEVLTVGDEMFQRKCAEKFLDLKESGKTIVIVSHSLGMVRDLCNQVALLDNGKLIATGSPGDVIDTYLGGVEKNVRRDGEHGTRFGEGGASIESIDIIDGSGASVREVGVGQEVIFRIHWSTERRIPQPVFRLEFHLPNGMVIAAPNTRYHDMVPGFIEGAGAIDYCVPRFLLTPGRCDLSATLFDHDMTHPYDVRHRFLRFDVRPGRPPDFDGVVSLDGRWSGSVLPE
ncbi:MAG TPA: ABC transporter ATP-binding protein, partial [Acidimicrobiales bacterium]|nr:ABC transporter ATP-binding protein [Acidimicrobiales bacterium]